MKNECKKNHSSYMMKHVEKILFEDSKIFMYFRALQICLLGQIQKMNG